MAMLETGGLFKKKKIQNALLFLAQCKRLMTC